MRIPLELRVCLRVLIAFSFSNIHIRIYYIRRKSIQGDQDPQDALVRLSNIFLITVIFACFYFNFLRSIFSLQSLSRSEHFKGSQQKKFQVGTSFCEPLFLQKDVTPHEKSRKILSSETMSIVFDLSLKSTLMMSSAFFLNFFLKFFSRRLIFLVICSCQIPAFET